MKKWVAIMVLLAAAGIWAWRLLPGGAPTESALRQTAGVSAEVVSARAVPQGVEVTCRVSNTTARAASQVVLRVALIGADGQTRAANPLAGVTELAGRQALEARFVVPFTGTRAEVRPRVEVSLVRWRD